MQIKWRHRHLIWRYRVILSKMGAYTDFSYVEYVAQCLGRLTDE